jgi:nucleoside-diphosphate-sugar epimerase
VRELIAAGHAVSGSSRSEANGVTLRDLGATPVATDLFDPASVRAAVADSEAVCNLATKIPPLMRMRKASAWDENNRLRREATRHLVDAAIAGGAQVFVQESISFIYADGGDNWLDETAPVKPAWPAALDSTLEMEAEVDRFTKGGGRGVILRFGLFYGPEAQSTRDSVKMARRRMLPVIGKGDNFFSSIHVGDAARAVVAALNAPAGAYNVAEDEPSTQVEYAGAFSRAIGAPRSMRVPRWLGKLFLGGPAAYILQSSRVSNRKFKEATGWSPKYPSVREGFAQVAVALKEEDA